MLGTQVVVVVQPVELVPVVAVVYYPGVLAFFSEFLLTTRF